MYTLKTWLHTPLYAPVEGTVLEDTLARLIVEALESLFEFLVT